VAKVLVLLIPAALVAASGAGREAAITIDDLPRGGDGGPMTFDAVHDLTRRLLAPFQEQKIAKPGNKLEFLRHPFLYTGKTPERKRDLQAFLEIRPYRVAPLTLENGGYEFAALFARPAFAGQVNSAYIPSMESNC
jgi:hypothetical protein